MKIVSLRKRVVSQKVNEQQMYSTRPCGSCEGDLLSSCHDPNRLPLQDNFSGPTTISQGSGSPHLGSRRKQNVDALLSRHSLTECG